jgi:hypothetical protein
VKAVFVELPAFTRYRVSYVGEEAFLGLQQHLMANPEAGVVIPGTGGLRKLRLGDSARQKGKRGGLRIIYFWWQQGRQFWLFTLYRKGEMADLSARQKHALRQLLKVEIGTRQQ